MTLSPLYVMSIDPGLDALALATFRMDPRVTYGNDIVRKCAALTQCTLLKTKPDWPLNVRLTVLAKELRTELAYTPPDRLLIEVPAVAGAYARAKAGTDTPYVRGGMDLYHAALGVILMVATELLGVKVVRMVKAGSAQKKAQRQHLMRMSLTKAGKDEAAKYGSDRLDAIFVGASEPWDDLHEPVHAPLSPLRSPAASRQLP